MTIIESAVIPEVRDAGRILLDFQADERARQEAWYREKQMHDEASQLDEAFEEGFAIGFAKGFEEERRKLLISFVRDGVITMEEAAKRAGLSVAEFQKLTES